MKGMRILGFYEEPKTFTEIFSAFVSKTENVEPTKFKRFSEAKTKLFFELIEKQLEEKREFVIEKIDNACPTCSGVGKIFRLQREMKEQDCPSCRGTGIFTRPCKFCSGTGKYQGKDCTKCDHGVYKVACRKCQSSGKVKRWFFTGKIEQSNLCPTCHGTGLKEKEKEVTNPVMPKGVGELLREGLPEQKKEE